MKHKASRPTRMDGTIANADVIAFALDQLGGTGQFVEIEDLFIRCYELAPKRFGWRTKPFPNYKTLYQALVDFERAHPSTLLKTRDGLGRQLSAAGVAWVRDHAQLLEKSLAQPGEGMNARRPSQRLLNEFLASAPMRQFSAGGTPEITRYQAADLLIASPDSPPSVWRERLAIYRTAAESAGRPDVKEFLDLLEATHREWFTGVPS